MSDAISNGAGLMPSLLQTINRLSAQNDGLTAEESTGISSDSFAGFGDQTYAAVSLEPQITAVNAWQANILQTQTKLSTAQTALTSISSIASNLQSSLLTLNGESSKSLIDQASQTASKELTQLTSLLNTQSGDTYVFSGSASGQPAVTSGDLAQSGLVTSIMASVATVGTTGAAATEDATLASASDNTAANSVFSASLSQPTATLATAGLVPQIQVGENTTAAAGILATQGSAATSTSTGSPIRDLIRALAITAGLSSADSSSPEFTQLVSDTATQVGTISSGLLDLAGSVGEAQDSATSQGNSLTDLGNALTSQLGTIVDTDPATVRTQQVAVQNQLTASYTLIADMKTLNLAQYL